MKYASTIAAAALALVALARPAAAEETPDTKSPEQALAFSGGVTLLAGIVVLATAEDDRISPVTAAGAVGLAIGPSLGHVYAGEYVTGGLALRAAGATVAILGYREGMTCSEGDCNAKAAFAGVFLGVTAFAAGAIWDIATSSRAAYRWNERHGVSLSPVITGDGAGVSVGGVF